MSKSSHIYVKTQSTRSGVSLYSKKKGDGYFRLPKKGG